MTIAVFLTVVTVQGAVAYTPPPGNVYFSGIVYYADGVTPFSGATVEIYYPDGVGTYGPIYSVTSSASGHYEASGANTGAAYYKVIARSGDAISPKYSGTVTFSNDDQRYTNDCIIPKNAPVTITGRVTRGTSGVSGAYVSLSSRIPAECYSDPDGYYRLTTDTITGPADYRMAAFASDGVNSTLVTVHVYPGATISQNLEIPAPTTIIIEGNVTRGGSPANALVGLFVGDLYHQVDTDPATGYYRCEATSLAPANVRVFAVLKNPPRGTSFSSLPVDQSDVPPGTIIHQDIAIPVQTVTFNLRVPDNGTPPTGAQMYVNYGGHEHNSAQPTGVVDSSGRWTITTAYYPGENAHLYAAYGSRNSDGYTVVPTADGTINYDIRFETATPTPAATARPATPTPTATPSATALSVTPTPPSATPAPTVTPTPAPGSAGSSTAAASGSGDASPAPSPSPVPGQAGGVTSGTLDTSGNSTAAQSGNSTAVPGAGSGAAVSPILYVLLGGGAVFIIMMLVLGTYLLLKRK